MDVYVSVGRAITPEQELFLSKVEKLMRELGLNPRILGRNENTSETPMVAIEKMINECAGTVIVAYSRYQLNNAVDIGDPQKSLAGKSFSTSWNQIEAALSFSRKMPVLCFCENTIEKTGLLEQNGHWFLHQFDIADDVIGNDSFRRAFSSWVPLVKKYKGQKRKKLDANAGLRELVDFFNCLKLSDQIKLMAAVPALIGLGWVAHSWLGGFKIFG